MLHRAVDASYRSMSDYYDYTISYMYIRRDQVLLISIGPVSRTGKISFYVGQTPER
jgi:hypothetical protein